MLFVQFKGILLMKHASTRLIALTPIAALAGTAMAMTNDLVKPKKKPRRPNPAMEKITDNPKLPRVLLIGDSISIGYTISVRKLLADKANVHRPPTNCGPTIGGIDTPESSQKLAERVAEAVQKALTP